MSEILDRLEHGEGRPSDVDLLNDVADNILGKSFCALGDAAAMPVMGFIKHFRAEFEHHVTHKKCMVNRRRAEIAAMRGEAVTA
jgi:NADH-quinone oxidoreductase subunit F